ncbi:MAG: hypothetical protein UX60_C0039G0006 [Berkelbacteria bacterium GW2011_GWA2_46_7]|uniref:Uncharacterized protein n=1 Tax=Berkelbacteria bacterium GW2011_GWA2_46_7 TaxID=1618335 RepID=A0A0G1QDC8_9BACT|nr:MAG: hypothetical protein UX60_C0039G0006 [Berkelbacteria bacterium GW2011_GWA2_46_7]
MNGKSSVAPKGASSTYAEQAQKAIEILRKLGNAFEYAFYNDCGNAVSVIEGLLAIGDQRGAVATGWALVRQMRNAALPHCLSAVREEIGTLGETAEAGKFHRKLIDIQVEMSRPSSDLAFDVGFRALMGLRSDVYQCRKEMENLRHEPRPRANARGAISIRRPGVTTRHATKSARNKQNRAMRGELDSAIAHGGGAGSKRGK